MVIEFRRFIYNMLSTPDRSAAQQCFGVVAINCHLRRCFFPGCCFGGRALKSFKLNQSERIDGYRTQLRLR